MKNKRSFYVAFTAMLIAILACSAPGGGGQAPDLTGTFSVALTAAFGTAQAGLPTAVAPGGAGAAPVTPPPGVTLIAPPTQPAQPTLVQVKPTDTPAPTNTPGAQGCSDGSEYVTDVTIPDNTVFAPGQAFTKTWRLKNSGTCTWVGAYSFAFAGGDQMGGPASVAISGNVAPGSLYDVSVNLVAPATPGTYKGSWRLKNATGSFFGTTPFVQIVVAAPTATATNTSAPPTPTATFTATTAGPTPTPTAVGSVATDYNGNWYNNDPATNGITQLVVAATTANQVSVHGWGRCSPSDCDWGTGTGAVSGNTITVSNFSSAPGVTVVLSIPASGTLRAVYTSGGAGPFTYDFHIGPTAADWAGTWVNTNAGTNNITRIIITASGSQLSVHPFGKCTPSDCDWGTKTFAYANPLNTGSEFPHNIIIRFQRANEMTVEDTTVAITENFRR
ncbi:MAG: NBR1-Ig-like domain-containing protein [Chloroflexota bacterium]